MITLIVLFLILAVVLKIAGDRSSHNEADWYTGAGVAATVALILLIGWAFKYHKDAIEHFLKNY